MAKSFRFPRWVEKTRTYSIHPVAFIDQPVATPHQPRYAQQLPPGGSQGGCAARVAKLATPTWLRSFSVYERVVTGRVKEATYRYKPRAALSDGFAAAGRQVGDPYRLRSFRFMSVSLPSGSGNYRMGTEFAASLEISGL